MSDIIGSLETISKILVLVSASVGIVGALIQYRIKVKAEERLRYLAVLETDIKVSGLFSELVSIANGYGKWSEPQERLIDEVMHIVPDEVKQNMIMNDPRSLGRIAGGASVPQPVSLSAQLAASESAANLAIQYPFLLEPALTSLDVVVGFMPQAEGAYDRLCEHYGIQRPLTNWGFVPDETHTGFDRPDQAS
jgi:hypothetical protein